MSQAEQYARLSNAIQDLSRMRAALAEKVSEIEKNVWIMDDKSIVSFDPETQRYQSLK